jgi:hypothetical protein
VAVDNALLRQTAAAADRRPGDPGGAGRVAPGPVSVFDLAALMAPGDRFTAEVGGVTARCSDGVHFTTAAGEWLAPKLLPMLQALGRAHHLAWPAGQWPGAAPPVVPSWWRQLDCP